MELLQQAPSLTHRGNGTLDTDLPTMRRRRGRRKNVEGLELLFMANKRAGAAVGTPPPHSRHRTRPGIIACLSPGRRGGHQGLGCGGRPGVARVPRRARAEPKQRACGPRRPGGGGSSRVQQRAGGLAEAAPNLPHGHGRIHTSGFFYAALSAPKRGQGRV